MKKTGEGLKGFAGTLGANDDESDIDTDSSAEEGDQKLQKMDTIQENPLVDPEDSESSETDDGKENDQVEEVS